MRGKYRLKAVALAAIATLGLSGLGISGAFGFPDDPTPPPSSITEPNGSLSIHKYTPTTTVDTDLKNNGTLQDAEKIKNAGANPIEGVKFKIRQITNLDIKTNEGWKKAEELSATFNETPTMETITGFNCTEADKCTLGAESLVTTAADGSVKKSALPVGFYFVEEANAADDDVTIHSNPTQDVKAASLVKAKPFIISIPLTEPTKRNSWMYDVHVYPKNSTISNEKKVEDAAVPGIGNTAGGSRIKYIVETGIPIGVTAMDKYMILDALDARLDYVADYDYAGDTDLAELSLLDAKGAVIATPTLEKTTDYKVYVKKYENITSTNANPKPATYVTIEFTEPGRTKLINARDKNAAKKIRWTLFADAKKSADGEVGSKIPNKSYVIPPNSPENSWNPSTPPGTPPKTPPGNPSNETVSKYGKVVITKKGSESVNEGDSTKLNGAKFKLYMCDKDGQLTKFDDTLLDKDPQTKKYSDTDLANYAVKVGDKSEWVTGTDGVEAKDGKIVINGLQLNDFKNGSANEEEGQQPKTWAENHFYCLVETQAPAGYSLIPEPIKFQLLVGDETAGKSFDVKNVPSNGGFEIPITGGRGIALIAGLGGALIVGSMIYNASAARKRNQEA